MKRISLCGTKECFELQYGYCLEDLQGYKCGEKPEEKPNFKERCKSIGDEKLYKAETKYYTNIGL